MTPFSLKPLTCVLVAACVLAPDVIARDGSEPLDFNRDIRPILSDKCFQCHGPDANTREADLRLDTRDGLFANREGLAVVSAGKPQESLLLNRVFAADPAERMPPEDSDRTLTAAEREALRRWVAEGAPWSGHWALEPVRKPELPTQYAGSAIDYFIEMRLNDAGLTANSATDRPTWIRRVSLDLTGLPPTPKEVDAFLADESEGAFANVVDRLLSSPRYGEHMAWWWLDAARYADSDGYESDPIRNMWPWRDWVVTAFNENMSWDRFIVEQLAGDQIPDSNLRSQLATGFNRNHRLNNEGGILPEEWLVEYVCDRAETTATVFMGLTWGCARCHDHKFDPITQRDYYRLFAFFNRMDEKGSASGANSAEPMLQVSAIDRLAEFAEVDREFQPVQAKQTARSREQEFRTAFDEWLKELKPESVTGLPKALASKPVAKWDAKQKTQARQFYLRRLDPVGSAIEEELAPLRKRRDALIRTGARVMVMKDSAKPRDSFILARGQYNQPGEQVHAGTPDWLPPMDASLPNNRLGLARWLVDRRHPLTARVAVNRFWDRFFGAGLVATQEDFGAQGASPSHPDLLDWLAASFVESGWNTKGLVRQIVLSDAYRRSSSFENAEAVRLDPKNRLLWRGPRHRLSAPVIRDQALYFGGLLVEKRGGRPVRPYQPDGLWREIVKGGPTYKPDSGEKLYRRSLYTLWRRAVKPPLMMLLDSNERDTCRVSQRRTNTPLQALILLNDVTFVEAARALATRIITESAADAARIENGFRIVTARTPTAQERLIFGKVVQEYRSAYAANPDAAAGLLSVGESDPPEGLDPAELATWTAFARLLLNLDEVVTRE